MKDPDFIVVGRGLMGTACARHLAEGGARVALVGPDEPADLSTDPGPFASHHDEARITRRLAVDPDWSRLSSRSIDRYGEIRGASGLTFHDPCGAMMVGPDGHSFTQSALEVAASLNVPNSRLGDVGLAERFPYLSFTRGTTALWEASGGVINPRRLRAALEILAARAGAQVHRDTVRRIDGNGVVPARGEPLRGGHVVLATGGYAHTGGLLPARPVMDILARTIVFARVTDPEAAALAGMPAMIWMPHDLDHDLYLLPPVRYPDGQLWIKIGGQEDSRRLTTDAEMAAWFRSDGDRETGAALLASLRALMPGLTFPATRTGACVISNTPTGHPFIERLTERLTILTGGNGAAAKNCDEIGRLGAMAARGESLAGQGYDCDFRAVLA